MSNGGRQEPEGFVGNAAASAGKSFGCCFGVVLFAVVAVVLLFGTLFSSCQS